MESSAPKQPIVRVGVAGWDYPDWIGPVYPPALRRTDRLAFLSRFVDLIEINATFYRPVAPRVAESWLRRTAQREGFAFAAKAHRSWTHDARDPGPEEIATTLAGLQPLRDAGRLRALLVQFPQSFRDGAGTRERIEAIVAAAGRWPLVVELRHAGWQRDAAWSWFSGLGAGWCVVDQPAIGPRTARPLARTSGKLAYLRLHGRNAANWVRPDAGRDARYDYLYGDTELAFLAETARSLSSEAQETIVVQNNHFRGQAVVNALQLKRRLQRGRPLAPQTLVSAYPQLRAIVREERDRLF